MSRRVSWFLAGVVLAAAVLIGGLLTIGREGDGWVTVGALERLKRQGVTYVEDEQLFLVVNGSPLALSAITLPGRTDFTGRVLYCGSDGWFYSHHGIFDHLGYYRYGPAGRGLDRVALRVVDGHVQIDPDEIAPGPPRSATIRSLPPGPSCEGWEVAEDPEEPPGFIDRSLWGSGPATAGGS